MATKAMLAETNRLEFQQKLTIGIQQLKSKLRNCVTEIPCNLSEQSAFIEVFEPREGVIIDQSSDLADTDYKDSDVKRRNIRFTNVGWAERFDPFATLDSGINPLTPLVDNAVAAMHRLQDKIILNGMLGENHTSKLGQTPDYFEKDKIIPMDAEAGTFYATLMGQLVKAKAYLIGKDVDVDSEQLYVMVPSDVWQYLFSLDKATSRDYLPNLAIQTGRIEGFLGFTFVNMESVIGSSTFDKLKIKNVPNLRSGVKYVLPCWCKSGGSEKRH